TCVSPTPCKPTTSCAASTARVGPSKARLPGPAGILRPCRGWALAQFFAPSATRPSFASFASRTGLRDRPAGDLFLSERFLRGEISLPGSLPCLSCRAQRSICFSPHTSPTFNVFVLPDVDRLQEILGEVGDGP